MGNSLKQWILWTALFIVFMILILASLLYYTFERRKRQSELHLMRLTRNPPYQFKYTDQDHTGEQFFDGVQTRIDLHKRRLLSIDRNTNPKTYQIMASEDIDEEVE